MAPGAVFRAHRTLTLSHLPPLRGRSPRSHAHRNKRIVSNEASGAPVVAMVFEPQAPVPTGAYRLQPGTYHKFRVVHAGGVVQVRFQLQIQLQLQLELLDLSLKSESVFVLESSAVCMLQTPVPCGACHFQLQSLPA
jgi:hypothetical protein